jgi:methyltransferase (TIGR00027 family)
MRDQSAARTTFFDGALERHLSHIDQLVILGAGLDTRAYRLAAGIGVHCFEVDMPKTQSFKREMLRRAHVDSTGVTYVPADFESEDWFENLVSGGFEPGKPSSFLWEAVTMYLDRLAVETTLRRFAACAPGSVAAFDYFASQLMEDRSLVMGFLRAMARLVGEPFGTFGIDNTAPMAKRAAALLESCGLTLEEIRTFGEETTRRGAPAGFAIATV